MDVVADRKRHDFNGRQKQHGSYYPGHNNRLRSTTACHRPGKSSRKPPIESGASRSWRKIVRFKTQIARDVGHCEDLRHGPGRAGATRCHVMIRSEVPMQLQQASIVHVSQHLAWPTDGALTRQVPAVPEAARIVVEPVHRSGGRDYPT